MAQHGRNLPEFSGYFAQFSGHRYDASVFGIAGRRLVESVVALFALLGFAFVPLGRKTALEHTLGIFTTPAALDAWQELGAAAGRLRDKVLVSVMPQRPAENAVDTRGATPAVPELPTRPRAR